ncbi:MAG: iron ABC transporter permease [Acidimicrobiia bacterium]|nr:iron ABC transporter permease [Acidimicrobiia bacterium]
MSTSVTPTPRPARLRWGWLAASLGVLGAAVLLGSTLGPAGLSPVQVVREMIGSALFIDHASSLDETQRAILWEIRVPRVVLGGLVGGMLALAGASYQGVFRNPLADPYLLGVAAGAGLGATLVIAYVPRAGSNLIPIAAFVGAVSAVAIAYLVGRSVGGRSTMTLILAGIAVAAFFTAAQTYVQQRNGDTIRQVYSWILGRLSTSGWSEVLTLLPYVLICSVVLLLHRRLLDVMSVGDHETDSLGISSSRVRGVVVIFATLGTAAAVAVSGLIAFVGIVVPHAIRLVVGSSYRSLIPLSMVVGAAFLILADLAARTVASPAELPIGVITAFLGAPFFAVVLRTSRQYVG